MATSSFTKTFRVTYENASELLAQLNKIELTVRSPEKRKKINGAAYPLHFSTIELYDLMDKIKNT